MTVILAAILARDQKNSSIRRRTDNLESSPKRSSGIFSHLKRELGGPLSIEAAAPSAPWTTCTIVEMTKSEICAAEFAPWTIFDETEGFGNDTFLGECMRLYAVWCWLLEDEDDEDEVIVEPEAVVGPLTVALLPAKGLLPSPSAGALRALTCSDLLMTSLAALLFETRHFRYINERCGLPAPPKWMTALEAIREMDPPNTLVSTVSLPYGWDAVSARLSSSSIFNLFSDRPASTISSIFNIDPTGAPSTVASSTVSVPASFWDTSSTVSVSERINSAVTPLFTDPTSAHSSSSIFSIDPSGCSSTTTSSTSSDPSMTSSSSFISTSSASFCSACQLYHGEAPMMTQGTSSDSDYYDEEEEHTVATCSSLTTARSVPRARVGCSCCRFSTASSSSSGYESEVDNEPVVPQTATTPTEAQKEVARMLAECDFMMKKLVEMKKKLEELH